MYIVQVKNIIFRCCLSTEKLIFYVIVFYTGRVLYRASLPIARSLANEFVVQLKI